MTVQMGMLEVVVRPYRRRPSPATKKPISAAASASDAANSVDLPVSSATISVASSRRACKATAISRITGAPSKYFSSISSSLRPLACSTEA